jgi:transposase
MPRRVRLCAALFRGNQHDPQGPPAGSSSAAQFDRRLILCELQRLRSGLVRKTLKASYSHTGRPSIDPEVLLRILLIGYLYGITSERQLVEDVAMHLAYRWFTGLGFDQEVPHHSTFSKNRHGRFRESSLFLEPFERIVQQCMNVGLLKGSDLSVDSTQIRADASPDRTITREQLPEVAKVNRTVREYVEQVERENVVAEPAQTPDPSSSEAEGKPELRRTYRNSPPMKISTTDPEAALSSKRGASEFAYYDNYLIDNRSCIIAGVMATPEPAIVFAP